MRLLAIDPASYKCGIALFEDGRLIKTATIKGDALTPLGRRLGVATSLAVHTASADKVASEEPFLLGFNANGMQRLLGMVEYLSQHKIQFYHPMTIKKIMGHGSKDKLEVALAAGRLLSTSAEQDIMADAIHREAFDETDAVAVGLTCIHKGDNKNNAI